MRRTSNSKRAKEGAGLHILCKLLAVSYNWSAVRIRDYGLEAEGVHKAGIPKDIFDFFKILCSFQNGIKGLGNLDLLFNSNLIFQTLKFSF